MRNSFFILPNICHSQTDIKIAHIFLESGRNRIFLLHFLRPHKQHRFPAGLLQFVYPDKISGHLPLHMTENMFSLSCRLYSILFNLPFPKLFFLIFQIQFPRNIGKFP